MATSESKLKQRIIGALVLIGLAVVFLPMLFKQEDAVREVVVQTPPMPHAPTPAQYPAQTVAIPEPQLDDTWEEIVQPEESSAAEVAPVTPIAEAAPVTETPLAPQVIEQPAEPVVKPVQPEPVVKAEPVTPKPAAAAIEPGIDKNNLPVSWSVQLASLTNKTNAEALRDKYRKKQYNAYMRSKDGMHRVFIGPLIKETDAQSMCKTLKSREGQDCFVVRYQP